VYARSQDDDIDGCAHGSGQQWATPRCDQTVCEENSERRDESLQATNAPDASFSVERLYRNAVGNLLFPDIFGRALPRPDQPENEGEHNDPIHQDCRSKFSGGYAAFDEYPDQDHQYARATGHNREEPPLEGRLIHSQPF